jgi:hypothetical protein
MALTSLSAGRAAGSSNESLRKEQSAQKVGAAIQAQEKPRCGPVVQGREPLKGSVWRWSQVNLNL